MPSIAISMAVAVGLAVLAGTFLAWLRARYGPTERTYVIYGVPALLGGVAIFLMDRYRHYQFNVLGIYIIVLLLTPRFVKFKPTK
jgi:hypothetical protein